jgi:predicted permease
MTVDLEPSGYDRIRGREFYRQLAERLDGVPGVRSVSWAAVPPVNEGGSRMSVFIKGYQPQNNESMEINFNTVGLNYFGTLGIPLLKGRDFNGQDAPGAPRVVIVNETMARRYWPDQDAVGKQINLGDERGPALEIIGIAKDGKYRSMREAPRPSFYLPLTLRYSHEMTLHLAATTDPRTLIPVIRRDVQALDPELPILNFKTLSNQIDNAMMRERMAATLCGVLAFLALLLAATGVYGVLTYAVSTRVREIGIRMALGAKPLEVLTQIVGESMVTVGIGIVLGLVAAFYLTGALSSLLYGVNPADPATFAGIAVLLMLVALAASYVPARRASKVDPMVALRFE